MARFAVRVSLCTVRCFAHSLLHRVSRIIPASVATMCAILLLTVGSFSQEQPGVQPFSTQGPGPISSIDVATGAVTLNIPIRSKTGKFPLSYSLRGSSGVTQNANGGWNTLQYILGLELNKTPTQLPFLYGVASGLLGNQIAASVTSYQCGGSNGKWGAYYNGFAVVDPTGASHPFPSFIGDKIYVGQGGCTPVGPETLTATDGSGFTLVATGGTTLTLRLYDKAGNNFTVSSNDVPASSVQDPDGVTAYWSGSSLYDTLGTVFITATQNGGPSSDTYVYKDASGDNQTYTVAYTPYTVQSAFGCPNNIPSDYSVANQYLPTRITTPTGAAYTLQYEQTPNQNTSHVTGRIAKIILPSGGYESFQYQGGSNGINCSSFVVPTLIHKLYDNVSGTTSVWKYVNNNGNQTGGGNFYVAETDPAGDTITHYFSGEYETERIVQDVNLGTVSTTVTCYNGNNSSLQGCVSPSPNSVPALPITQTDVYTYMGSTSVSPSVVQTVYDNNSGVSYGNVTAVKAYGVGATYPPSGTPLKIKNTIYGTYNSGSNNCSALSGYIFDKPCDSWTVDQSNNYAQITWDVRKSTGEPTSVLNWITGSTSLTTQYAYNAQGVASSITDPNTSVTGLSNWSCNSVIPFQTTYPLINSVQLHTFTNWDCNGGVIASTQEANERTTTYTYADPLWRLTAISRPDGGSSSYSYSTGTTLPWSMTATTSVNPSSNTSTTTYYDGLGRVYETATVEPEGGNDYVYTTYDVMGRVATVSNPCRSCSPTGDPTYGLTTYTYDALNRVIKVTNADGTFRTSTFSNHAIETIDESNIRKVYQTDGLGRLTSACEVTSLSQKGGDSPTSCGAFSLSGFVTSYTYNGLDQITSVAQSNLAQRTYSYDGLGRMTKEVNPESGITQYVYDHSGQQGDLYTRTRPKANQTSPTTTTTTTYTFDPLHRLTNVSYSDGTPNAAMQYDTAPSWALPAPQNVLGRLTYAASALGTASTAFGYDKMGHVNYEWQCTPQNCGKGNVQLTFTYDYAGDITQFTDSGINQPTGAINTYTYDATARLTEFQSNLFSANYLYEVASNGYNPLGEVASATLGNNIQRTASYDNRGRPLTQNDGPSGSVYFYSLTWGNNNDLANKNEAIDGSWTYTYDDFNRLTQACRNAGSQQCPGNPYQELQYLYDEYGNRYSQNLLAGAPAPQPQYLFNGNNQISNVSTLTYDAAGNETADGLGDTFTYDAEGRMTGVGGTNTSASYVYDALSHRARTTVEGVSTDFIYDLSGRAIDAMNTTGGVWTQNWSQLYAGNLLVAESTNGTTYFYHPNWQGTVREKTDPSQNVVFYCQNLPFGDAQTCTGSAGSYPLYFTGQILDTETDFTHFLYRQYSMGQGNWMTPDPAGTKVVDPTNPQSWNRYVYVMDNPVSLVDPQGLYCAYLNDAGDGVEEIDDDGDTSGCQDNGGYWIQGSYGGGSMLSIDSENGTVAGIGYDSQGNAEFSIAGAMGSNSWGAWTQTFSQDSLSGSAQPNPIAANTDPQTGVPVNPCGSAGSAPNPSSYVSQVQQSAHILPIHDVLGNRLNQFETLLGFWRGGPLDAQTQGGSRAYGNYVFGAALSGSGFSLPFTLSAANTFAYISGAQYPGFVMDSHYGSIPAANVANITNGYNAQQNGTLCHK